MIKALKKFMNTVKLKLNYSEKNDFNSFP